MKKLLFLIALLCALKANAQNYLISFAGTGESVTVNTVKVENLTKGTSLTLNGNDVLRLVVATGVNSIIDNLSSEMTIYPNPMRDNTTLEFYPPVEGAAIIEVCDMTGKPIVQIHSYFENSRQNYGLSGLKSGFYLINVRGNNYQFSGKLVSHSESSGPISINKISNSIQAIDKKSSITDDIKGSLAIIDMAYTAGDRLKLTGVSGIYSTVITDVPVSDKTVTFNFITCTDGDNNNYQVVVIGTQIWMAENLKTTKYKDSTPVPLVEDAASWAVLNAPGYCWYNNDAAANKSVYGALYHWLTINTGNLCPSGWHIPSDVEWTTLTNFLGGEAVSAGKLKETGTTHWQGPNTGATNEFGFTALPGGNRGIDGTFSNIGSNGYWDSATEYNSSNRYGRAMNYNTLDLVRGPYGKRRGLSVRCLKD
jgi:uncharacterized protein (TIGR02145 family)